MSRGERILQGSLALHHETLQVAWDASLSRVHGVEYQEAHERYIIIRFELDSEETCWALRPARELLGPHPVANRQWDQRRASMQGPQGKRRGQRGSLVATTFGTTCPEHRFVDPARRPVVIFGSWPSG